MIDRAELGAIIARDATTSREVWFNGPASFTALAARDRAKLLRVLRELSYCEQMPMNLTALLQNSNLT